MKSKQTCPTPLPCDIHRRAFLRRAFQAASVGVAVGLSFEEKALLGAVQQSVRSAVGAVADMPMGRIGKLKISRLICGGNLISGYAHSRDLIYVSSLLKHYFTDERILDTWEICEEHGINTMVLGPHDSHGVELYKKYRRERGGTIQWLAQAAPKSSDFEGLVKRAVDDGAVGVFLIGNQGDRWTFDKRVDRIAKFVETVRALGVAAGVAGHSLEMLQAVEAAGIPNDFYMKTLHHTRYWSARKPDQTKPVVDNYAVDNYWDMEPEKTVAFMQHVAKPWIAYKVLAAGAIHPREGFDFAFAHGADFVCVGMFDFQIGEDAILARQTYARHQQRPRPWRG